MESAEAGRSGQESVDDEAPITSEVEQPHVAPGHGVLDASSAVWARPVVDAGASDVGPPSVPLLDAAIANQLLGKAFAEDAYNLTEPPALAKAFASLAKATGSTRLFVTELRVGDAGTEARYGPADLIDGGLIWQKPPARPRSFAIAKSATDERTLVSVPFKYVLEARVQATASSVFRLYLEAEQSVWSARFSADSMRVEAGELRGVLTREEVEHRPLDLLVCTASCGVNSLSFCRADRALQLATVFDCNAAEPNVDTNGDGVPDGYRLVLTFASHQVAPPSD